MNFPILYKEDSRGYIREWYVTVDGDSYTVTHGVLGGQKQSKTTKATAKNIGRGNETTPEEQAVIEAQALHTKMLERECYVVDLLCDQPKFLQPMLALDATKVGHRINWANGNIMSQKKLDGIRAIWRSGEGLQSRKGTFYNVKRIEDVLSATDLTLDGELYLHGVPLNRINGAAKKWNPLTDQLEFHVFDLAVKGVSFSERYEMLKEGIVNLPDCIKLVDASPLTLADLDARHNAYVQAGYEGLMIRDAESHYGFGQRSTGLFKYKAFKEDEFLITGVVPDKHHDQGTLELITDEGNTFNARARGTDEFRREMLLRPELFIGKQATVRYFSMTEFNIPQFPVVAHIE